MKHLMPLAIALAASFAAFSAHGETYQWKDANGHTVISDMPPPTTLKAKKVADGNAATPATTPAATDKPAATGEKTTAEKNMEFKKRQQEAREKADKEAKEQQAANGKRENCERARSGLAAMESGQSLSTFDENGQRRVMGSNDRQQEADRLRRIMEENCK